ncbi:hypothetical protein H4N58_13825 [Mumia sp. ZJ1417]|uniref:hypothetical protein n=1 Tax=Mumia sp. ZJ1417 TaxID=2708082 RepID=UPI00142343B5|nr:hypothetical protein [Mumia sp. ZJ1417]QMW65278.1 hypothetical protein H4N58_13825 [Mumia sp. ZJ1417]
MTEERVPVDPESSRAWVEVAQGTRISWHIFRNVPLPCEGSNFAAMRDLYPYEPVDERARSYVGAALEHLVMWADHAAPFKFHPEHEANFHQRPPYTLARAAMESAAQAVWMLDTREPVECVRRHLCLIRWDLQEHKRSKLERNEKEQVVARENDLIRRVSQVFTEDETRPPQGYLWVLQRACDADGLDLGADRVERLWRAASGSAHGMYWPTQDLQRLVEVPVEDGKSRQIRVADTQGVADVLRAAYEMTQYAVLKYAEFAGADIWALLNASRAWLASKVTIRDDADPLILARLRSAIEPPEPGSTPP